MLARALFIGVVSLSQSTAAVDPALLFGLAGCLAAGSDQSLIRTGDRVVVLARGVMPAPATVHRVTVLGKTTECHDFLELQDRQTSTPARRAASVTLTDALRGQPVFAIVERPGSIIRGGPRTALTEAATKRWRDAIESSLDADWRGGNLLVRGYQFGKDESAVELYVGRLTQPPTPSGAIQAISVRRYFIIDRKPLGSETFERATGRGERVDAEAPKLTRDNWTDRDGEGTVAFVTADKGKTWNRLSTNVGFEGTWWIVQSLTPGLPPVLERYLYTGNRDR